MITSSKAIPAKDTEVGLIYKQDGTNSYFMRTTNCGSVRTEDEGCLFVRVNGSQGVIKKFDNDTMFKQVDAELTIDD